MALLTLVVLGFVATKLLPVSLIPDVDIPYVTVQVSAPNLSAREMDRTVLKQLRSQLVQIEGLEDIRSEAKDGSGVISLTFRQGSDIDYAFIEANEKVDRSMSSLSEIDRPRVLKSSASDIPAFYINITLKDGGKGEAAGDDFRALSSFASEVVSKRIEQLSEVSMVDISGTTSDEILIIPDMEKLKAAGLTEQDFEDIITSANVRLGSLSIRDGEYRYSVKFKSFAASKEDIEGIYVNLDGKLLQVKDLATVTEQAAKRTGLVRSDGKPAVTMAIIKQSDARMSALRKGIDGLMEQFAADYPQIGFTVTRDQTQLLEYSISNLVSNIIVGVLLACLVIFLFMRDFRSPTLVALTMPAALIITMLSFYVIGLTINIISLSGLILGVGMMTDNTVVLIDNITARWQRGEPLRDAVIKGTGEVMGPMLSSVLTTVAVFVPLIFLSGIAGAMFYDQAMAITIVLFASYFVTIIVIPVYYWWWYKGFDTFRPSPLLERFSFDKVTALYERGEAWILSHRWLGWSVLAASAVGMTLCFAFMPKERLPEMTYTDRLLKVDWNAQLSLEQNSARVSEIEALAEGEASQVTAMVGMQQFVLGHSGESGVSEATVYLSCPSAAGLEKLSDKISNYISKHYPKAIFSFQASGNIFEEVFAEKDAELEARLRPISSTEIETGKVMSAVERIAAALPDVAVPQVATKKDILYVANPDMMALYEVSYDDLFSVLQNSLNGNQLFEIVSGSVSVPVVFGTDAQNLADIIGSSFIERDDGIQIPVSALMRQTFEDDLKSIVAGTEGNYYPVSLDIPDSRVPGTMSAVQRTVRQGDDFEVSFSGAYFNNNEMIRELILVLLVAILLLYLILASQFESLLQPLIVLSEVVIDIFFSLVVLWLCGVSVNLMSLIGLVVICGIVINDSILKIDTMNRLRKEGLPLERAVTLAGSRRFKAIVMTSLTTILAVLPFLQRGDMGSDLQFPMSLVIVAGMIVGTIVSLFFIPMLYYGIYRRKG